MRAGSGAWAVVIGLVLASCSPDVGTRRCQRYEGPALVPENGFAASMEWTDPRAIDASPERIDVSMSIMRPVQGTIDLVHVVEGREVERWELSIPRADQKSDQMSARCWIATGPVPFACGATIRATPHPVGGYYYLRPNGNTVLEAGVAFYLCN